VSRNIASFLASTVAAVGLVALSGCAPEAQTPRVPEAPVVQTPAPTSPTGVRGTPSAGGKAVYANDREAPARRPVSIGDSQSVDLLPPAEVLARPRRRLNLDQLARAMTQVSGGIGWTETRGNTDVNLFNELSATLGKPDYIQVVSEDLEPSSLFLKFLDDAARSICGKMVVRDLEGRGDPVIFKHVTPGEAATDEDIDANLAYLVRRFHGHQLAPEESRVQAWRWLFDSVVHVTGEPIDGWNAVCVGLYTHVDFYSY
jgi:hypothetical protein